VTVLNILNIQGNWHDVPGHKSTDAEHHKTQTIVVIFTVQST